MYRITVHQYISCDPTAAIDPSINLGIINLDNNGVQVNIVNRTGSVLLDKGTFSPCISSPPTVCYHIDYYTTTVELQDNVNGYALAVQRCCRINGIINVSNSGNVGITYTNTIPGSSVGIANFHNSSAIFAQKDTAVVCFNGPFTFDFSATDPDNDSLVYSFTDGIVGGNSVTTDGAKPAVPTIPPYSSVPYSFGYSGSQPLGGNVTIDAATGLISGIAPGVTGDYVVAVYVKEYRQGVLINSTRKEIHITVADCSLSAAGLKPSYINCDSLSFKFSNESSASTIVNYMWTFGDKIPATDTSSSPTPTHTYSDTGVYKLKLKVVATGGCEDSATSLVKVYPGFKVDFSIDGSCIINPYQFNDQTYHKYGTITSWTWDFGEPNVTTDTSTAANPTYTYPTTGTKNITFNVTTSVGCTGSVTKALDVSTGPVLSVPFHDTLICAIDSLALLAYGTGSFAWTPDNHILNRSTASPIVYPVDTTMYYVTLTYKGCVSQDSIKVNVIPFLTIDAGPDTAVCKTDTFRLHPVSYGMVYKWTTSTGETVAPIKYPLVQPLTNTKYYVTANVGKCFANDSLFVKVAPYPTALATGDTTICFGNYAQLSASYVGAYFSWSPANSLLNANTAHPTAGPSKTTAYIFTVSDTIGCPKPTSDTVLVSVIPQIIVNAGNDTSIVVNQPLQLNVTTSIDSLITSYLWTPGTGLDNTTIHDPIATLSFNVDSIVYTVKVTEKHGCFGSDDIKVVVFKTPPEIFVPTGFTPNGDGKNDILKPITVGIANLNYFSVYNRLGQLIYSTTEIGKGWDGTFGGNPQPSGTYVFMAQGIDYSGKAVFRKGTVVLIR
ncbi:PKD domain-containing protein [Chitinophagaceae bacterium LWZ2-11]